MVFFSSSKKKDLRVGCDNRKIEDVQAMLSKQNQTPECSALRVACANGQTRIVCELLKDPRVDPSALNNLAIRLASSNGHLNIVVMLLRDSRVDPSDGDGFAERNECIRFASLNGHTEVVRTLLKDSRVDPSADNDFALRVASLKGYDEIVAELLQDRRVNPTAGDVFTSNEPIRVSCHMGHVPIVKLLLNHKNVDPAVANNFPLRMAAIKGHHLIVAELMQHPKVLKDLNGLVDALKIAKEKGFSKVALELLKDPRLADLSSNSCEIDITGQSPKSQLAASLNDTYPTMSQLSWVSANLNSVGSQSPSNNHQEQHRTNSL